MSAPSIELLIPTNQVAPEDGDDFFDEPTEKTSLTYTEKKTKNLWRKVSNWKFISKFKSGEGNLRRRIGVPTNESQDNFNSIYSPVISSEEGIAVQVVDFFEDEFKKYKTNISQLTSNDPSFSILSPRKLTKEKEKNLQQHDNEEPTSPSTVPLKNNPEVNKNTVKQVRIKWISKEGTTHKTFFKLAEIFNIQCPVEVEEIVEQHNQTARILMFQNGLFITCPILLLVNNQDLVTQQINILIKGNLIITFFDAESEEPFWSPILKKFKRNLEHVNTNYILSQVLLSILDKNSKVISHYGNKVDNLELRFTGTPNITDYQEVQVVKRELLLLRKSLRPIRDVIETVEKISSSKDTNSNLYFKELDRKVKSVLELIETLRELCVSMHELYDMLQDRRMNGTLYLLTIITVLFVPPTFMAGVYGTNFKVLPELEWPYSYPTFWGVIIVMWILMLTFFKYKGWITLANQF